MNLGINWLDFALILTLGVGLLVGYSQGLLRQVISLAALYLGTILGAQYASTLSSVMRGIFPTTPTSLLHALAFFIIMFGVMIVLNLLAFDAYHIKLRLVPAIDHLGGMILGLIATWVLMTFALNVIAFATQAQNWEAAEWVRQTLHDGIRGSQLADATVATLPALLNAIRPWLPAGMPAIFSL